MTARLHDCHHPSSWRFWGLAIKRHWFHVASERFASVAWEDTCGLQVHSQLRELLGWAALNQEATKGDTELSPY